MTRPLRLLAALAPAFVAATATAHAADRPNVNAYAMAPQLGVVQAHLPGARIASRDAQTGAPTLLFAASGAGRAPRGATTDVAGRGHLSTFAAHYAISPAALATAELHHVHDNGRGGIVATYRQRIGGIEVFRHDAKVMMSRSLDLVAIGGNLHAAGGAAPKGARFSLREADALAVAFGDLFGKGATAADFLARGDQEGGYLRFDLATKATRATGKELERSARVKKVWFPLPDRLVPAYFLEVFARTPKSHDLEAFSFVVAADDGRLLYRENLSHHDAFTYRVWADSTGQHRPADGPLVDYTPYPFPTPNGSFPNVTSGTLISMEGFNKNPQNASDPWLAPTATQTTGNNVDAYTDDDNPEGFSSQDVRANTTSDHTFDWNYDFTLGPQANDQQRKASITSLFYLTNWMHDYWYDSGFNEAAGNAQDDNFGRGGLGGDPLQAQAQDGAPQSRNNSNMNVPGDGSPPVMQMFVWDGVQSRSLTVGGNAFANGPAAFGPTSFDVTAPLVLANDGTGTTTDACEAITNSVAGAIVLVDRGTCTFQSKAVKAQEAGAIGVIIADNDPQDMSPFEMQGDGGTPVTIPVLGVTLASGNALKAQLGGGPQATTMHRESSVDRDGTLDNTVAAHEWGHYLHLRQVACMSAQCGGESEGWGDFNALMMIVRPGDDTKGIFPMAAHATGGFPDDPAYFGIRRYPYSVNKAVDPLTFKHIEAGVDLPSGPPVALENGGPNNEAHSVGEIWAVMLFEAYVSLLDRANGASPPYSEDEAHRRMADYVEGGLQLAPTDPTITEQRDAVLAAAAAADKDDFVAMAKAFAKRGAGTCAVSPDRYSQDLTGVVEDFEVSPNGLINSVKIDDSVKSCDHDGYIDVGETGRAVVEITNTGAANLTGAKLTLSATSKSVTFPKGNDVDVPDLAPFQTIKAIVDIALADDVKEALAFDVVAKLDTEGGCTKSASVTTSLAANVDEDAASSATDDVESATSVWKVKGEGGALVWSRVGEDKGNHAWSGVDFGSPSDTQLESPLLKVGADEDLVMSFDHAYSFEQGMGTNWDGAVIEFSTDQGATWEDVATLKDPGYGGPIGQAQANNPLRGRQGFVGRSEGYPKLSRVKVDLGKTLAGKDVLVRFRIGSDDAQGDKGWLLDNIGFEGITNTPFTAIVPDAHVCKDEGTGGSGGGSGGAATNGSGGAGEGGDDGKVQLDKGCGCELPGQGGDGKTAPALTLLALLGAAFTRRRRRA